MNFIRFTSLLVISCIFSPSLLAQKIYYWNPGKNNKSSNAANWHLSSCSGTTGSPGKNDSIVFTSCNLSNPNCTIDKTLTVAGVRIAGDYSGTVSANSGKKITFK